VSIDRRSAGAAELRHRWLDERRIARSSHGEYAMDWREHIVVAAERQGGQPCMRGTRFPLDVILDNRAAGESDATILAE